MVFGWKQQDVSSNNIYFSFATEKFYENAKSVVSRMALKSAGEFFQLPKQLFSNSHKGIGQRDQSDNFIETNDLENKGLFKYIYKCILYYFLEEIKNTDDVKQAKVLPPLEESKWDLSKIDRINQAENSSKLVKEK